ncbi:MAG: DUF6110 family protein [Clostridia bacterium]|nr:DUF6110 family protein [Clostridia bacterium]
MSLFGSLFEGNKELALFLGGVLMGTAGIRVLTSDDARKVYVQGTAAALRGKEEVMTTATTLRENCEDIYAEAIEVNEKRAAKKAAEAEEEIIEDIADAAEEA